MHDDQKKAVVRKLASIAEGLLPIDTELRGLGSHMLISGRGGAFILHGQEIEEYRSIIADILKRYGDKFSERSVSESVNHLITDFKADGEYKLLSKGLDELVDSCESYDVEQRIYVPIAGINLSLDSLILGEVEFLKMELAKTRINKELLYTEADDERRKSTEFLSKRIEDDFSTNTCARLTVVAEPERAKELAIEECQRVLDLLILCCAAIYQNDWRVQEGMRIQTKEVRDTLSAAVISPGVSTHLGYSAGGPITGFDLDEGTLERMSEIGAFRIADIMKKLKRTGLENQVLRSVHWFAESQVQKDRGNELLGLITCLEMFLTPADGAEPIRANVAEGTAILLEDTLDERKRIRKFINAMYRKRSSVTHGSALGLEENELSELRAIVIGMIMQMTKNPKGWTSLSDVRNYILCCKLS